MKYMLLVLVSTVLVINLVQCGVVGSIYDKVKGSTQLAKDDLTSWWNFGKDMIFDNNANGESQNIKRIQDGLGSAISSTNEEVNRDAGLIVNMYHKFKDGVSTVQHKIHDVVLSIYDRIKRRLSQVKSFLIGNSNAGPLRESSNMPEEMKDELINVLYGGKYDLFKDENEKKTLESLRNKLAAAGDDVLDLAADEKALMDKAFNEVRQRALGAKSQIGEAASNLQDNAQNVGAQVNNAVNNANQAMNDQMQFNNANQAMNDQMQVNNANQAMNDQMQFSDAALNLQNNAQNLGAQAGIMQR